MKTAIICMLLLAATGTWADEQTPQQLVDHRRAEIEKKKPQDRAEEYAKLAVELTDLASTQYDADKTEDAGHTVTSITQAAIDSVKAAKLKRKNVKKAEIKLRECSRKLDELKHRVRSTDQAAVAEALKAVEKARSQLLEVMFGK